MPATPFGSSRNWLTGTTTSAGALAPVTRAYFTSRRDPSLASSTSSGFPRSVQFAVPRVAVKTAPTNESAARTPDATACSCDAAHLASPVGSGVGADLAVAVAAVVGERAGRGAVGAGVALTLAGAVHDTSISATSRRSIAGR